MIGFMSGRSADAGSVVAAAFRQGLNEAGFVADRNVTIEYRWAADQLDRLPAIAAELVSRPVSVIAVFGTVPAKTAQVASTTIPIVFLTADDPVTVGLVANLNRPGGNVTGVSFVSATLGTKRLELLRALAPKTDVVAVLLDPHSTESQNQSRDVQEAAGALGVRVVVLNAGTASEIDTAFATLVQQQRCSSVAVRPSAAFTSNLLPSRLPPRAADDVRDPRILRGRRPDQLWRKHFGFLSPSRYLRRPNSKGRQALRRFCGLCRRSTLQPSGIRQIYRIDQPQSYFSPAMGIPINSKSNTHPQRDLTFARPSDV